MLDQLLYALPFSLIYLDSHAGTDHHDFEDMTSLAITSTPAQVGSFTSDAALADVDLVDVLCGCLENQADADQLAAGLLEMEDELKALTDDTSFLQFPCESPNYTSCMI